MVTRRDTLGGLADPRTIGWAPDAEKTFQAGIRATPWFAEFKQRFGEEPDLNTLDYDYRKAWAAGSRPDVRDPGDKLLHWSSQFKGEKHPNRYVNGVDTITGARMGDVVAPPGTADWMAPPKGPVRVDAPSQQVARRFGVSGLTPPPARSAADAYRMGGLAATDRYKSNTWRDIDREAIEDQYGGADIHGIKLPPVSKGEPRAWFDAVVPQTPLDVGLTVAGGPVGGKLARGGAAALGALFQSDEAEAGALGKIGKAVLAGKPGGPHPGGIHVYHSSPHDFDRFDWNKLRSGQGANTYGSGFYFAENPAVSGQGGQYWEEFARKFQGTPELEAAQILRNNKFDRATAIEEVKGLVKHYDDKHSRDILKLLESDKPIGPRTYEVNINARPELMLDWDKSWQAQPKLVQEVARASGIHPESTGAMGVREMSDAPMGELTGRKLQDPNSLMIRNMREASIPGIRYLDQGSRNAGDWHLTPPSQTVSGKWMVKSNDYNSKGLHFDTEEAARAALAEKQGQRSYNYVVTDPSKLDILAKYGVVGGAPVGMGALAAQDQYRQGRL